MNKEKLLKGLKRFNMTMERISIGDITNSDDTIRSFQTNIVFPICEAIKNPKTIINIEEKEKIYVDIKIIVNLISKTHQDGQLNYMTLGKSYPLFIFDESLSDEKYRQYCIDYINNYKM